jgi:hypothetical protein
MRKSELSEKGIFKSFNQGIKKGFKSTQKGGALAPDAYEKSVKDFFSGDTDDSEKPTKKQQAEKPKTQQTPAPKAPAAAPAVSGYVNNKLVTLKKNHKISTDKGDYTVVDPRGTDTIKVVDARKNIIDLPTKDITKFNNNPFRIKESKETEMDKAIKEGLADLAHKAEADHEVQMARADLYKIAKYAIKLHDMLKGVSEEQGLEGWQQAKITKAADYISSVYHNLDYDMKFGESQVEEGKSPHKKGTKKYKKHMAAMHAGMNEDAYKAGIAKRLAEKLGK